MSPPKLILEKQDEVEVIEEAAPSPVGAGSSVAFLSRSSVVAMIGGLVSQGLKFLVLVYVARKFSVPEFGLLSFAWAVYAFQFVICNSGLQFFGSRAVAKSEQVSAALLAEICCLRAALAILGTFLSLLVVALLPGISRTELFLVGLFGLSNLPWAGFFDWAFQGLHRQEVSAILNVILQGSWLALSAVGMHLGFGLPAVPAALVMATLIASAVGYLWLKRTGGIVKMQGHEPGIFRRSWATLKSAAPLALALWLNTVLIWTDAILVRLLRGERAVGWYAAGNRAGLALAMLAAFYVQGAFPLLSRASQEGLVQFRRLFQHCYEDMALVFVPGSIWGIVYAHDIVLLVFKKPEYLAAVPVFQTFQIFVLVTALASLHGIGVLAAFHRDREYRRAYIVATAVFIPLCVALTLFLGILGAALAVVFAQLLALILFVRASQGLVRAHHISALAVPLALGVLVTMACRLLGVTVLWSAALLVVCNLGLLGLRFRKNYLHEALS